MHKTVKGCLIALVFAVLAAGICLAVWLIGTLTFGLPTARASLGPPAAELSSVQEAGLSVYLMLNLERLDQPAGDTSVNRTVEVSPGETAGTVIEQLTAEGIIGDAFLFRAYIRYLGLDRGIEAGSYALSGGLSIRELAAVLQSGRAPSALITIPEGWRAEEIAARLDQIGSPIAGQAFLAAVNAPADQFAVSFVLPGSRSLEGYLFPDTYQLESGMSATDLIQRMLTNFDTRVDDSLRLAFQNQGLSLDQAVILASIVEREAVVADERPRIAAVFLNRLAIGMRLDADPTVQYAIAIQRTNGWWPQLSLEDLQFDSPYNTYRYDGLPPGAIASPGLDSLRAVAFPLETSELYFRALCDGSGRHAFAETFEQHQANSCP